MQNSKNIQYGINHVFELYVFTNVAILQCHYRQNCSYKYMMLLAKTSDQISDDHMIRQKNFYVLLYTHKQSIAYSAEPGKIKK